MKVDKLVRNNIPSLIVDSGKKCTIRKAKEKELESYLHHKLCEEVNELLSAKTKDELMEEIADVQTVLEEIASINDIQFKTNDMKIIKKNAKGDFSKHIILMEVSD